MLRKFAFALCFVWLLISLAGCSDQRGPASDSDAGNASSGPVPSVGPEFRIVSGSENQTLQPIPKNRMY